MKKLSPVIIFAYRRPLHLRNTLESLMSCDAFEETPVILYCDGAKEKSEIESVMATRELARSILGDRAEYHFSEVNLGLSYSVISGVTEVINRFGRAIVVEDDLKLNPFFLTFMNQALDRYAEEEKIFQISGYMFDAPELRAGKSALFLPLTVSWGWATWKRAWYQFDPMATDWETLSRDKVLRNRFNLDGSYDYSTMLERQMKGLRDSWAVRWYWTVFKKKGMVLFPPISLVKNTGFDGSGTHGNGFLRKFSKSGPCMPFTDFDLPMSVAIDPVLYNIVKKALRRQNGGWISSLVDRLRRQF